MTSGIHIQAGISGTVGSDGSGHGPYAYDQAIDCGFGSAGGSTVYFRIDPVSLVTGNIYLHYDRFSQVGGGQGLNVHYKVKVTDPFLVPQPTTDAVIGQLMYTHLVAGYAQGVIWPGGRVGELYDWSSNTHLHLEWTGHDSGHYFKNSSDSGYPDSHSATTNMGNLT